MFKMKRFGYAMFALLIASAVPAHAALMLNVGGVVAGGVVVGGVTYTDNQAGVDANPTLGILDVGAFLNTVSVNFVINGFAATSGSPIASLSMNSNANLVPAAVLPLAVDFVISDTGYSNPATPLSLSQTVNLLSSIGGITANGTAVGYYGDSNANFDVDGPNTGVAIAAVLAGVGSNTPAVSGLIAGPTPYSLTSAVHVDITGRGVDPIQNLQINANLSASAIPEPGTLMLMAGGLSLVAARLRNKRK